MSEANQTVASTVNPEAGHHPISSDPTERMAAIAATRRSWKEFPYYPRRYGERGWRFSLSDSGWIETLCGTNEREFTGQLFWLGGLLAARGMPCYLLERHLEHLHDELIRSSPEASACYEVLQKGVSLLRERRLERIPAELFESLSEGFQNRVDGVRGSVANMGRVLVAAVADDRAGVAGVLQSVSQWACDPTRFDGVWVEAVRQTVAAARGRSR
jgi:hypothetical protein